LGLSFACAPWSRIVEEIQSSNGSRDALSIVHEFFSIVGFPATASIIVWLLMACRLVPCTNFACINAPERSKIFRQLETIFLARFSLSTLTFSHRRPFGTTPSKTLTPELPAWSFISLGLENLFLLFFSFPHMLSLFHMHYRMQSSKLVSVGSSLPLSVICLHWSIYFLSCVVYHWSTRYYNIIEAFLGTAIRH